MKPRAAVKFVYSWSYSLKDTWTFVTSWGYNSADAVKWMQYPGGDDGETGEKVSYDYHNQGSLDSVLGDFPQSYVYTTEYDAVGRVVERQLGANVLQMGYEYYNWGTQGGRLEWLKGGSGADPTALLSLHYDYDSGGNITEIEDYKMGINAQTPQEQDFSYRCKDKSRGRRKLRGR